MRADGFCVLGLYELSVLQLHKSQAKIIIQFFGDETRQER